MALPTPNPDDLVFITTLIADMNIIKIAVATYAEDIGAQIDGVVKSILILYVVIWGYAMMRGVVDKPAPDAFLRFIKMAVVIMFATFSGMHTPDVIGAVWGIPNTLFKVINNSGGWYNNLLTGWSTFLPDTSGASDFVLVLIVGVMSYILDFGQGMATADANALNTTSGAALLFFGGGLSGLAFAIVMVCKASLAVLLALAPVFIMFILFEKTKPYFDGWVNAIVTFMLTLVLLNFIILLLFPILLKTILIYWVLSKAQGGVLEAKQAFQLMVMLGIYFAIVRQVPLTAASIARGYAASASGRWDSWDQGARSGGPQQQNAGQVARQSGQ